MICIQTVTFIRSIHRCVYMIDSSPACGDTQTSFPKDTNPDSKVRGANMGPIWGRQDLGGPHVGPMNFAIWDIALKQRQCKIFSQYMENMSLKWICMGVKRSNRVQYIRYCRTRMSCGKLRWKNFPSFTVLHRNWFHKYQSSVNVHYNKYNGVYIFGITQDIESIFLRVCLSHSTIKSVPVITSVVSFTSCRS